MSAKARMNGALPRVTRQLAGKQLVCGFRNQLALMSCAGEIQGAGLPLARTAGNSRRSVRAAAHNFIQSHLPLMTVGEPYDDHAEMQQIGEDGKQSHFLPAMLSGGRGERTAHFAVKRTPHPQAARLIEEARHL